MKILITVTIILIASCGQTHQEKLIEAANQNNLKPKVTVIDGCEYFVNQSYYQYYSLTHKGNCNNQIHIYNKLTP